MTLRSTCIIVILLVLATASALRAEEEQQEKGNKRKAITIFNDDRYYNDQFTKYMPPNCSRWSPQDALAIDVDVAEYSKYAKMFPNCGAQIEYGANTDFQGTIESLKQQGIKRLSVIEGLDGEKFQQILTISDLTHLYVNCAHLQKNDLQNIGKLKNLTHLSIVAGRDSVIHLRDLPNIKSLAINQEYVSLDSISSICNISSIETLILHAVCIDYEWKKLLDNKNIRNLILNITSMSLDNIEDIRNARHLKGIAINTNGIDLSKLSVLSDLDLEYLSLVGIQSSAVEFFQSIQKIKSLRHLVLDATSESVISNEMFQYIQKMNLETLICSHVNGERLREILQISSLKNLIVGCNDSEKPTWKAQENCPSLERFEITGKYNAELLNQVIGCAKNAEVVGIYGALSMDVVEKIVSSNIKRLYVYSDDLRKYFSDVSANSSLLVLNVYSPSLQSGYLDEVKLPAYLKVLVVSGIEEYNAENVQNLLKSTEAYCMFGYMNISDQEYKRIGDKYPGRFFPQNNNVKDIYQRKYNCFDVANYMRSVCSAWYGEDDIDIIVKSVPENKQGRIQKRLFVWKDNDAIRYIIISFYSKYEEYNYAYYADERYRLMEAKLTREQWEALNKLEIANFDEIDAKKDCRIGVTVFSHVEQGYLDTMLWW